MIAPASVLDGGMLPDARVRDTLRLALHRAINVERRFTTKEVAEHSGVNIHTIAAIMSQDMAKHRTIGAAVALSIAVVLGCRAVNAILALIGYGGAEPLDETGALRPAEVVAGCAREVAVIAEAAVNGFNHLTTPGLTEAADRLIATVIPFSSAGQAE